MRTRLLVFASTAAAAVVLAVRKSIASQRAERELWAEATDDVRAPRDSDRLDPH